MCLRLSHEGEHGINGGPPGDLYVAVSVKPHPIFTRKGNDILVDFSVHFVTAALGGKVEVPTLKGKTSVKIPEGTQYDRVLRLKGIGAPALGSKGKTGFEGSQMGDQLVRVKIQIPTKLSSRQRELLSAFAKESDASGENSGEGIFDKVKNIFD